MGQIGNVLVELAERYKNDLRIFFVAAAVLELFEFYNLKKNYFKFQTHIWQLSWKNFEARKTALRCPRTGLFFVSSARSTYLDF